MTFFCFLTLLLSIGRNYDVRADEEQIIEQNVQDTQQEEKAPVTFTKGRITYEVTEPIDDSSSVRIGKVKITGNSLKSAVTGCSITLYVTYEGREYAVDEIGDSAFAFSKLEEIVIPNSVRRIGQAAFYGATRLNTVELGDGVEEIGDGAFSYCESLENIKLTAKSAFRLHLGMIYTADFETLVSSGFASDEVVLRQSTKIINAYAFEGNSRVTSVTMNKNLKTIGDMAFYDCSALESVSISSTVSSISGNPFEYCPKLRNIDVAAKNKSYKSNGNMLLTKSGKTLISCPASESSEAVFPDTVRYIKDYAFSGNTDISSVKIPSRIKSIGIGAFNGCSSLTSVKFVSCKTSILPVPEKSGEKVFGNTKHYLNVYLPYKYPSDEFMDVLKQNCPKGTIYVKSK